MFNSEAYAIFCYNYTHGCRFISVFFSLCQSQCCQQFSVLSSAFQQLFCFRSWVGFIASTGQLKLDFPVPTRASVFSKGYQVIVVVCAYSHTMVCHIKNACISVHHKGTIVFTCIVLIQHLRGNKKKNGRRVNEWWPLRITNLKCNFLTIHLKCILS